MPAAALWRLASALLRVRAPEAEPRREVAAAITLNAERPNIAAKYKPELARTGRRKR